MAGVSDLKFILRALKSRNYRLFFSGQIISLIGTWLTTVATSWLVYRLARETGAGAGKSAFILGVVGFASQAPQLLMAPLAGAWVDRLDRHRVLIITQTLSMVQSFVLTVLAFTHKISIPAIVVLNIFQGLVNAFDIPARQSLTVDLVERREDLSNAIALSSSMVHAARLIGPALAGVLIYHYGEGSCFLIDGFSYLAVLIGLLRMTLHKRPKNPNPPPIFSSVQEGVNYAWGFPPIRVLLLFVAATSLFSMPPQTLLPVFAQQILGGGERIYGLLLCASGLGALCGALFLASRRSVVGLGRIITRCNVVMGLGYMAFAFSKSFYLASFISVINGCALITQIASANSILQTIVDENKRGRVMGLFALAFMGTMPLGSLMAGTLAQHIGIPWTIAIAGVGSLVTCYFFARTLPKLRVHVEPIYMRLGLLAAVVETPH